MFVSSFVAPNGNGFIGNPGRNGPAAFDFENMSAGEITAAGWVTDGNGVRTLAHPVSTPASLIVKATTADGVGVYESPFEDWDSGELAAAGWTEGDALTRTLAVGREFAFVLKCTTANDADTEQVAAKVVADSNNLVRVVRKATTRVVVVEVICDSVIYPMSMGAVADETAFVIAASFSHRDCVAILDDGTAVTNTNAVIPAGLDEWTVDDASWEGSVEALDIFIEQCAVDLTVSALDRITVARKPTDRSVVVRATRSGVVEAELDMGPVADETAFVVAARIKTDDFEAILDDGDAVTDDSGTPPPNVSLWTVGSDRDKAHPWGGTVEALEVL